MKKYKYILAILLSCCFCIASSAQSSYKGVTIDRGPAPSKVSVVIVINGNPYPCKFNFEYKIESKESHWRNYATDFNDYQETEIGAHESIELDLGEKIYGLKLTYVDIEKPTFWDYFDAAATGWVEGKANSQQQQNQ